MRYISPIDPHVHLRWQEYPDHSFTAWALEDAASVGLAAVVEMPNTQPPLLTQAAFFARRQALDHLVGALVRRDPSVMERFPRHYLHMGVSHRMLQMAEAFELARGATVPVCGVKMYCCHSTGDMGLLTERNHQNVWRMAVEVGYDGPVVIHAEDHTRFGVPSLRELDALRVADAPGVWSKPMAFDAKAPMTHSLYQHEDAETVSALQQCRYAREAGFCGTVVVAHTSSPDTVTAVAAEFIDTDAPFTVMFEVTWHHLFLSAERDYWRHGNRVKMNPPLRRQQCQEGLLNEVFTHPEWFFAGTDHAPHPVECKDDTVSPASGIPAIPFWPRGIELLRQAGLDEVRLNKLVAENARRVFGLDVRLREVEVEYDPSRWERYGWNPFSRWE